jgi:hypothetical protein
MQKNQRRNVGKFFKTRREFFKKTYQCSDYLTNFNLNC